MKLIFSEFAGLNSNVNYNCLKFDIENDVNHYFDD